MLASSRRTGLAIYFTRLFSHSRMCAPTVSMVVKHLKEYVTKHLHHPIWQKSFHDHVIRTQTDYEIIWLYIDSNPQTWRTDCLNPNRNQPQQSDTRKDVTL